MQIKSEPFTIKINYNHGQTNLINIDILILGHTIQFTGNIPMDVIDIINTFSTRYIKDVYGLGHIDLNTLYYDDSFYNYKNILKTQEKINMVKN